jgi:hypothetical protein
MENLTLKIAIPYDDIRKMVVRINGEIWDDKKINEYFSKRKTLEITRDEIVKMDKDAFEVFVALAVSMVELRNKPERVPKRSKFDENVIRIKKKNK